MTKVHQLTPQLTLLYNISDNIPVCSYQKALPYQPETLINTRIIGNT